MRGTILRLALFILALLHSEEAFAQVDSLVSFHLRSESLDERALWRDCEALGKALPEVLDRLHEEWFSKPGPSRPKMERIAQVLSVVMTRADGDYWAQGGCGGRPASVCSEKLRPLLETLIDRGGNLEKLALLTFERTPWLQNRACIGLLVARLPRISPDLKGLYGRAILGRVLPDSVAPHYWDCLKAAYDEALEEQKTGRAKLRAVPFFGVGPENLARAVREAVIGHLRGDETATYSGPLLTHVLRSEVETGLLGKAAEVFSEFRRDSAGMLEPARTALRVDNRDCQMAAMTYVEKSGWAGQCVMELGVLSRHYRADVREAARELLSAAGKPVGETSQRFLPPELVVAIRKICLEAMVDARGARRVRATALLQSSWGESRRAPDVPGWLLVDKKAGTHLFVSDELDLTHAPLESLAAQPVSFEHEVQDRIDTLSSVYRSNDRGIPAGFDTWVVGHPAHSLFLLAYAVVLDPNADTKPSERTWRLFELLMADYKSERDLLQHLVYEVAWLRYLHAVDCFGISADDLARRHAIALRTLEQYGAPQTDLGQWLEDGARILADLDARARATLPDEPPADSGEALRYWIARLPDIVIRQMGQPGGAGISEEGPAVPSRITAFGAAAIYPLFDQMTNSRLVRGCEFWRDFARDRHLYTVGEIVPALISRIVKNELGIEVEYRLLNPGARAEFKEWYQARLRAKGTEEEVRFLRAEIHDWCNRLRKPLASMAEVGKLQNRLDRLVVIKDTESLHLLADELTAGGEAVQREILQYLPALLREASPEKRRPTLEVLRNLSPTSSPEGNTALLILWEFGDREPMWRLAPDLPRLAAPLNTPEGWKTEPFELYVRFINRSPTDSAACEIVRGGLAYADSIAFRARLLAFLKAPCGPRLAPDLLALLDDRRLADGAPICDLAVDVFGNKLPLQGCGGGSRADYDLAIRRLKAWVPRWSAQLTPRGEGRFWVPEERLWAVPEAAVAAWESILADTSAAEEP